MDGNNALYKIAYQLTMNKINFKLLYEGCLADLGEDHYLTEYRKQQLAEAEEAERLYDDLRVLMLLREEQMEGGDTDEQ